MGSGLADLVGFGGGVVSSGSAHAAASGTAGLLGDIFGFAPISAYTVPKQVRIN